MENKVRRRVLLVGLYVLIIIIIFSIYGEFRILSLWTDTTVAPTYDVQNNKYIVEEKISDSILTSKEALDKYVNKPVGTIYIPRVGLEAQIIEGASNLDADMQLTMKHTVGHEPESYMPGEGHQVVLTGHREEQFGALEDVKKGDIVIVDILDNTFLYKVTEMKTVLPSGDEAIKYVRGESDVDTLVLYTCYPFQPLTPVTHRYVVKAERIEQVEVSFNQAEEILKNKIGSNKKTEDNINSTDNE